MQEKPKIMVIDAGSRTFNGDNSGNTINSAGAASVSNTGTNAGATLNNGDHSNAKNNNGDLSGGSFANSTFINDGTNTINSDNTTVINK